MILPCSCIMTDIILVRGMCGSRGDSGFLKGGLSMAERTQYSSGSISGLAGRVGLERVLIIAGVLIGWLIGTDPSAVRQHLPSDPGCLDLFNGLPAALNPGTAL